MIVDAHSDLLLELVHRESEGGEVDPFGSHWLAPLRRGGVGLQVCAIYVEHDKPPLERLHAVLRQAHSFGGAVNGNGDGVFAVHSADDLGRLGDGRIGLMLALEGASSLEGAPWLIDVLAQLGLRMASLTWNERNAFAGGCDHGEGLTPDGARLVDRMVELGIAIDLAHASPRTFADVLDRLDGATPLVSHAACRALYDHARNLDDSQLAALAARGGVLGLMLHPFVLGVDANLDTFLDHIDHAVAVMGTDHVGLGGDFLRQIARAFGEIEVIDGMPLDAALDELEGPQDYPALVTALQARGYQGDDLAAILGGNVVRVLRDAVGRA